MQLGRGVRHVSRSHKGNSAAVLREAVEPAEKVSIEDPVEAPWLVPLARPQAFVGRAEQLAQLTSHVSSGGNRLAIYGLGGCGKTALALELVYQTREQQPARAIFWVPAISSESFDRAYREIGVLLGILSAESEDNNDNIRKQVQAKLSDERFGQWLIIIDNADDAGTLFDPLPKENDRRLIDYLPRSRRGSIIFTTRTRAVAVKLADSNNIIALGRLSKEEGAGVLRSRLLQDNQAQLLDDHQDKEIVSEFLEMLTYFALAIVQAIAFINTNDITIAEYISYYRNSEKDAASLLSEEFEDQGRYRETKNEVATTWYISFEQILKQNSLAGWYLSFMACTLGHDIPASMLPDYGSTLESAKAIGVLKSYAFISERGQSDRRAFDLHPLVHLSIRGWLKAHGKWTKWVQETMAWLSDIIHNGDYRTLRIWSTYLPHATHAVDLLDFDEAGEDKIMLLGLIGDCEREQGHYESAERTFRRLHTRNSKTLGDEHPDTVRILYDIGLMLSFQGKFHEAEAMQRETLVLWKRTFGEEDRRFLSGMNNLAQVLMKQGKFAEAETLHRETLWLTEQALGKDHPDAMVSFSNIGTTLLYQGKYREAEAIHRENLERRTRILGIDHLDTINSMEFVASALENQRAELEEALSLSQEATELREKWLGRNHPDTLRSMNLIGRVLNRLERYEDAEAILRETLELRVKISTRDHPFTTQCMVDLGHALEEQGRFTEAECFFRETLELHEKRDGEGQKNVLIGLYNLAGVLEGQGRFEEALACYERGLRICQSYPDLDISSVPPFVPDYNRLQRFMAGHASNKGKTSETQDSDVEELTERLEKC